MVGAVRRPRSRRPSRFRLRNQRRNAHLDLRQRALWHQLPRPQPSRRLCSRHRNQYMSLRRFRRSIIPSLTVWNLMCLWGLRLHRLGRRNRYGIRALVIAWMTRCMSGEQPCLPMGQRDGLPSAPGRVRLVWSRLSHSWLYTRIRDCRKFQHVQPVTFTADEVQQKQARRAAAYRRHVVKRDTEAERRETAERRRHVDEANALVVATVNR